MIKNIEKTEESVSILDAKKIERRQEIEYFFPDYMKTVRATSIKEAEEKIKKLLNIKK
jgi:hypothetical protein